MVKKIDTKAKLQAGTPINNTLYDSYIDTALTVLDVLDNEVQREYGTGYIFLFQYLYPRVLELRKDQASTIIDSIIGGISGIDLLNTNTDTSTSTNTNTDTSTNITTTPTATSARPTKITTNCSDTSPANKWFKDIVGRCGDDDSIAEWSSDGVTETLFKAEFAKFFTNSGEQKSYLDGILCEDTYTYVYNKTANTDGCVLGSTMSDAGG